MNDKFELYEIIGVVLPGAVFLYGLNMLLPELMLFPPGKDMSFGGLGVFIIISYAAGHIVQILGGLIEIGWRYSRGEPSEWVVDKKKRLFSEYQIKLLKERIPKELSMGIEELNFADLSRKQWLNMQKHMYILVVASGDSRRLQKFQAVYVMCRGLVASLTLLAIIILFVFPIPKWYLSLLCFIMASLLLYRMSQFERHTVHELFLQFLHLSEGDQKK